MARFIGPRLTRRVIQRTLVDYALPDGRHTPVIRGDHHHARHRLGTRAAVACGVVRAAGPRRARAHQRRHRDSAQRTARHAGGTRHSHAVVRLGRRDRTGRFTRGAGAPRRHRDRRPAAPFAVRRIPPSRDDKRPDLGAGTYMGCAFSPDGRRLYYGSADEGRILELDVASGTIARSFALDGGGYADSFAGDLAISARRRAAVRRRSVQLPVRHDRRRVGARRRDPSRSAATRSPSRSRRTSDRRGSRTSACSSIRSSPASPRRTARTRRPGVPRLRRALARGARRRRAVGGMRVPGLGESQRAGSDVGVRHPPRRRPRDRAAEDRLSRRRRARRPDDGRRRQPGRRRRRHAVRLRRQRHQRHDHGHRRRHRSASSARSS